MKKYDLNSVVNSLTNEELYTLQIMCTNKLRSNSRTSTAVSEPVAEEPIKAEHVTKVKKNTNPDMTPELIREGVVVHTIKDVMVSKGRRYYLVRNAADFGGEKVRIPELVKKDKYVLAIKFADEKSAKTFMKAELENYLKFHKA